MVDCKPADIVVLLSFAYHLPLTTTPRRVPTHYAAIIFSNTIHLHMQSNDWNRRRIAATTKIIHANANDHQMHTLWSNINNAINILYIRQ